MEMHKLLRSLAPAILALSMGVCAHAQTSVVQRADSVAGSWEGTFEAASLIDSDPDRDTQWVGPMTGRIEANGRLHFHAENGCQFQGSLTPITNTYRGNARASACSEPEFNRTYSVSAAYQDGVLYVQFSAIKFEQRTGAQDSWAFGGAMRRAE